MWGKKSLFKNNQPVWPHGLTNVSMGWLFFITGPKIPVYTNVFPSTLDVLLGLGPIFSSPIYNLLWTLPRACYMFR